MAFIVDVPVNLIAAITAITIAVTSRIIAKNTRSSVLLSSIKLIIYRGIFIIIYCYYSCFVNTQFHIAIQCELAL